MNKQAFVTNIENSTLNNNDYRRVERTMKHMQLVYMSLEPGVEIGNEVHDVDQFIRIEQGQVKSIINNGEQEYDLTDDSIIMIPAGAWHNIINQSDEVVKLYTIYAGPEHLKDTVQATKADEFEDQFDGVTDVD